MFKEKYLIFKEGEPKPQFAEKRGQPNEGSDKRESHSSDTAEDLLSEKSVEEKVDEIISELYNKLFIGGEGFNGGEKFFKKTPSGNFIYETFLGDKMRDYVTEKVRGGFEFGGYGYDGITIYWWSPAPGKEMVMEMNPAFLDLKVVDLLNEETKKLIAKAKQEILEKNLSREIKPIFEELIRKKIIPEAFIFEQFIKSDFAKDLRDLTKVNYDTPPTAYTWEITQTGVSFTPSAEIVAAGFPETIELKIKDYDSNLNYKKNTPKHDAQEMIDEDEDEISEEQEYDEDLQAHKDELDSIAVRNKELEDLHFLEVKPYMQDVEDFISDGISNGPTLADIKSQIYDKFDMRKGIILGKLGNLAASGGSEQLVEDYDRELEEWQKTLFEKYKIPLNNYTSSDYEEDFEKNSYDDDDLGEEFLKEEKD
jgi:hypothetical protein